MFLSFFALVATPLLLSPVWTSKLYEVLWEIQRAQIALDNAAIRLARADRTLLNGVNSANARLRALELAHHPLHACARVPGASLKCKPPDLKLETVIRNYLETSFRIAQANWLANAHRARVSLRSTRSFVRRSPELPVRKKRCRLCGLESQLEINSNQLETEIESSKVGVSGIAVGWKEFSNRWDYELSNWEKR